MITEGMLSIGDDPQNMKEIGKVKDVDISFGVDIAEGNDKTIITTMVHCTIIRKKKNKVLTGRKFVFEGKLNNAQVEERIASYYISEGVIGKLKMEVKQYFDDIFEGKIKHEDKDMHFIFEIFYDKFRFIIGK